ncbi:MAG: GNAT family N-acetyltransferase [Acidobacteria bacterium]|nr:GNAT family N-acetyltransferase [Acidobacteriota bacterium]MBP7475539.1 GNAT family N-acetyltransferase [Pyrinomonadaceae bacterium]MBP9108793.1 GNAT family N-acetyltransferase [Pyrinomonadaceae bacterium]
MERWDDAVTAMNSSNKEPTVRNATVEDINILAALGTTTCYEAYFELDPSSDLADYCARIYSPENVRIEFEDVNSTYFIAEISDRAVGFAKLRENNHVDCLGDRHAIELQRIYVLERVKGQNVGKAMIARCLDAAREKGYDTLWLGVWEKNLRAQGFYEKIGMKNIGTTGFNDGKNDFVNFVYAINI